MPIGFASGGGSYDDVQATEPTNPSVGDTWFDTSTEGGTGKIYADLGNGADWQVLPVQDELQSGRTRELLMLMQNRPVPEVQSPITPQPRVSGGYAESNGKYTIDNSTFTDNLSSDDNDNGITVYAGVTIYPKVGITQLDGAFSSNTHVDELNDVRLYDTDQNILDSDSSFSTSGDGFTLQADLEPFTEYHVLAGANFNQYKVGIKNNPGFPYTNFLFDTIYGTTLDSSGDLTKRGGNQRRRNINSLTATPKNEAILSHSYSPTVTSTTPFKQFHSVEATDVSTGGSTSSTPLEFDIYAATSPQRHILETDWDQTTGDNNKTGVVVNPNQRINAVKGRVSRKIQDATKAYVIDLSSGSVIAETSYTPPNFILRDMVMEENNDYAIAIDNGGNGYTRAYYTNPSFTYQLGRMDVVESYRAGANGTSNINCIEAIAPAPLNKTRMPVSELEGGSPVQDRAVAVTAGSDGQSDFTIPQTTVGGHYGIPVLPVTVKVNGGVLDLSAWDYNGDKTITIDTSTVSIASGDDVQIVYDWKIYQDDISVRSYLNRESDSETSPYVADFRYEYTV